MFVGLMAMAGSHRKALPRYTRPVLMFLLSIQFFVSCEGSTNWADNVTERADSDSGKVLEQLRQEPATSLTEVLEALRDLQFSEAEISASDAMYLARILDANGLSVCSCALYRRAISVELDGIRLEKLRRNPKIYNRVMLLIRRSVEDCSDTRSLAVQALLASLHEHGHTTLALTVEQGRDASTSVALGVSSWYKNDFDSALQHFRTASAGDSKFSPLVAPESTFSVQFEAARTLERTRSAAAIDRVQLPQVREAISEAAARRSKALKKLVFPDLADLSVSALEQVDRPVWISKGAQAAKGVMLFLDLAEAFDAHNELISLREKQLAIDLRKSKSTQLIQDAQATLAQKRVATFELEMILKAILLRGNLALEYLDEACT